ncbi:arsenate reductase/protein-tyrosine-phosphatase family protein [Puerhibacterium puerhi]|uniref:arsenate reductase/protein-tyrosine-phosphatase family protein n=1 Tax=Puerhibacterium puerhi TaxID=2692623 RepID=UPI001358DE38|nr:low molecular weight phosphatase family protein [Puerhibacterium puerhi]
MSQLLCVCTGNICRSPAAEALLRRALDDSVVVSSAGTRGLPAAPVHEPMARLLAADGLDVSGFRSRALTARDVQSADLVLTLTAEHRSRVLELEPLALRRTVSLGELSRLAAEVPPGTITGATDAERLRSLVPAALALRHRFLGAGADDDVVDPYRLADEVYATSYAQITHHVARLATALRT